MKKLKQNGWKESMGKENKKRETDAWLIDWLVKKGWLKRMNNW